MDEDHLHVVFGTGQVGQALVTHLTTQGVSKLALRGLGLVNPTIRELGEMAYQFDQPFVLDTRKYDSMFGAAGTRLPVAIAATVAWYRSRSSTPAHTDGRGP